MHLFCIKKCLTKKPYAKKCNKRMMVIDRSAKLQCKDAIMF